MQTEVKRTTRRTFVKAAVAVGCVLAGRNVTAGGDLPKLEPSDPTAKSLGYIHQAKNADQSCRKCQIFKGSGDWGQCTLFPGKQVSANGWCKGWVQKTG